MKTKAPALSAFLCILSILSLPLQAQISFFEPPTYAGTGIVAPGNGYVFVADFNGDGKPDLLTTDGTLNLGKGDGTFTLGANVCGTSGLQVVAVADFNGDGKPDVLEQDTGMYLTLQVLLGNGDGTFRTAARGTTSGSYSGFLAAGDLNGDGRADVVTLVDTISSSTLFVYLGNGDGTFKSGVSYDLGPTQALTLSIGDFNGDDKADIAVSATGQEMVLLGNGNGTFQTARISAGVSYPDDAAIGDFNGDGKLDLVVDGAVLLGNGDGTFQSVLKAGFAGQMAVGDFNGDGKLDLVAQTQIFLGNGDGTFSDTGHAYLVQSYSNTVIADFNGDGKLDIAAGNVVLLGNGDGTFQGNPLSVGFIGIAVEFHGEVVGDFDNNGTKDIAIASLETVFILSNDGSGAPSLTHTYAYPAGQCSKIVAADLNGDGNVDLLVFGGVVDPIYPEMYDWNYSVLLGNGDGTFQSPILYQQSLGADSPEYYSVTVADFNNDGKTDIVINLPSVSLWALLLGNGDGTFAAPIYLAAAALPPLVNADFNGDGSVDIAGQAGGTALLFGNGDGTFRTPVFPPNLQSFYPQFTADLNHDGKPDLISGSQVALGNGDGTFTLLPSVLQNVVAIADLNGDGRPDVLYQTAGNNMIQTGVMLGNGDGTFGSPSNVFATTDYREVLVVDMNGDGRPDLVFVPIGGSGGVGVLLNTTAPGFELSATALFSTPLTAGNSATSTVTVNPNFGFNKAVALSCAGLPSGTVCAFNPPSIANSSGTSTLTVSTSLGTAAGAYPVKVQGSSGSIVNSATLSLIVTAAPDFTIGDGGSGTSHTISAGQTASFSLAFTPTGSFTGTVNLTCAVTPVVSPAPTCTLPSSVQTSDNAVQSVTVTVATTGSTTAAAVSNDDLLSLTKPLAWGLVMLGSVCLVLRSRERQIVIAAPIMVLALMSWVACGSSPSTNTRYGTPAGTYRVTVTASSGGLNHTLTLTVVVR
jgi:hypothetical protein